MRFLITALCPFLVSCATTLYQPITIHEGIDCPSVVVLSRTGLAEHEVIGLVCSTAAKRAQEAMVMEDKLRGVPPLPCHLTEARFKDKKTAGYVCDVYKNAVQENLP